MEKISFGAGCFWGVELAFWTLDGVMSTKVGYQGGARPNPSYEQVCSGSTGHIEVVLVEYDPSIITLKQLLDRFWYIHNPTLINQQGNDIGTQYQSAIFYETDKQLEIIRAEMKQLEESKTYDKPLSTLVKTNFPFYEAEEYHQRYLEKNPNGYCHIKGLL